MTESEARTRRERVDPKIRAAGWSIVPFKHGQSLVGLARHAITEYPTDAGPADYALCSGGRVLGVVEAKKVTLGPQGVLTQAERYSKGLSDNPLRFAPTATSPSSTRPTVRRSGSRTSGTS